MTNAIVLVVAAIIVLAIVVALLAAFYERATREVSLVRTGIGGRKVVMDGGVVVIPYFQQASQVNMQTLRLEVRRAGEAALITKDKMRVDVGVEFYVSVSPTEDGIARASQTLGRRTFQPDQLCELIEGMLVDVVCSVAVGMTMDELHENRGAFVGEIHEALGGVLERNGLALDSVSLTALDQTPFATLDENNAFNAVGMRKLAEVIAKSKKERAEIDSDAEVSVRRAAKEATKRKLQIDLEEREAEIAQTREIETLLAAQLAEVARHKAQAEREAAQARIEMEQDIRAADIAREQALREAEIVRDRILEEAEIIRQREIEMANQESRIVISAKSQDESKAQAAADVARAEATKAAEGIDTARQIAAAERTLKIALLAATSDGQSAATRLRLKAEAEKDVAADLAQARLEEAETKRVERLAEAEGLKALNEADNTLNKDIVAMRVDLARLEALPKVVAEMVKPAEKISSIKIHQINGLGRGAAGGSSGGDGGDKPAVIQALDSIMDMAVQLPALKKIGEELGLSVDGGLAEVTEDALGGSTKAKED
jgi:uncharacterized membrane protein YqiK